MNLKFIIVLRIVNLIENKNKKRLYTNFGNCLFIYKEERITLYRLQREIYREDREMEEYRER